MAEAEKRDSKNIDVWDLDFFKASPILSPLCNVAERFQQSDWPAPEAYNSLWQSAFYSAAGRLLRFATQTSEMTNDGMNYESRIHATGLIPTRPHCWHDFLNAVVWSQFPRSKRMLNHQHILDINSAGISPRTCRRDAITLFDECGVLVVGTDRTIIAALRDHCWKQAFWDYRAAGGAEILPVVFGHALYEMALTPFIGMCGKALYLEVPKAFFSLSASAQRTALDRLLATRLEQGNWLATNACLSPFPILGVPGYHPENRCANFYRNREYFRPRRRGS